MRKKIYLGITGLVVFIAGWIYFSTYHPNDLEALNIISGKDIPVIAQASEIKFLSWNIQFLAGNKNNNFFFEGGKDPWPGQNTIDSVAAGIAKIIREENPV